MEKNIILDSIKKVREISRKRKFDQTFDISINLKQLNIKNPEENVDLFLQLDRPKLKMPKICALVDKNLSTKAKIFDKVILQEEFQRFKKDKKATKKLASEYDYFVAQVNLMPEVAATFGRVLGPKGKMPNPKAGCVVPPTIDLEPIKNKLAGLVRLNTKDQLVVKAPVGSESMTDEEIASNIEIVHSSLVTSLPRQEQNIKSTYLKLTMSPSVQLTDKGVIVTNPVEKKEVEKPAKKLKEAKKDE